MLPTTVNPHTPKLVQEHAHHWLSDSEIRASDEPDTHTHTLTLPIRCLYFMGNLEANTFMLHPRPVQSGLPKTSNRPTTRCVSGYVVAQPGKNKNASHAKTPESCRCEEKRNITHRTNHTDCTYSWAESRVGWVGKTTQPHIIEDNNTEIQLNTTRQSDPGEHHSWFIHLSSHQAWRSWLSPSPCLSLCRSHTPTPLPNTSGQ
jgi:hypothetical protein